MSELGRALYEASKRLFRLALDPVVFNRSDVGIGEYEIWVPLPQGNAQITYSPDDKSCHHFLRIALPGPDSYVLLQTNFVVDYIAEADISERELWRLVSLLKKALPFPVIDYTYSYSRGRHLMAFFMYRGRRDHSIVPMVHVARNRPYPAVLRNLTLEKFWQLRQEEILLPLGSEHIVSSKEETLPGMPKYQIWCGETNWRKQLLTYANEQSAPVFPSDLEYRYHLRGAIYYAESRFSVPVRCEVPVFD